MSLSVKYSRNTERKLRGVLEKMMSEAILMEPKNCDPAKLADLVGELVQLLSLCRDLEVAGKHRRYDLHVYMNSSGVEWQYFQADR